MCWKLVVTIWGAVCDICTRRCQPSAVGRSYGLRTSRPPNQSRVREANAGGSAEGVLLFCPKTPLTSQLWAMPSHIADRDDAFVWRLKQLFGQADPPPGFLPERPASGPRSPTGRGAGLRTGRCRRRNGLDLTASPCLEGGHNVASAAREALKSSVPSLFVLQQHVCL